MIDPPDDPSMKLHGYVGKPLASRKIAVALAEMVFTEVYGEDEFKVQLPLNVIEASDRWIVEGNPSYESKSVFTDQIMNGKLVIEILKDNCRIVKLVQMAHFAPQ